MQLPLPEGLSLFRRIYEESHGSAALEDPMRAVTAGSGSDTAPDGSRRQYLRWTLQLQERFLEAVLKLGGLELATPSRIAQLMQVSPYHILNHFKPGKPVNKPS